jgi:hypothetical protein
MRGLQISAVNIGEKDVHITSIGWKVGIFTSKHAIQLDPPQKNLWKDLPASLTHGETANWFLPIGGDTWETAFIENILTPWILYPPVSLKVQVHTSVGLTFEARIDKSVRTHLSKIHKNMKAKRGGKTVVSGKSL